MSEFKKEVEVFYKLIGKYNKMVLATSANNRTTARMVSCIIDSETIYFQTDKTFLKYEQILENSKVALCLSNIQIEGIASVLGHPMDKEHSFFAYSFEKYCTESFKSYTHLKNERLISVAIKEVTIWEYEDKRPLRKFFDFEHQRYKLEYYNED